MRLLENLKLYEEAISDNVTDLYNKLLNTEDDFEKALLSEQIKVYVSSAERLNDETLSLDERKKWPVVFPTGFGKTYLSVLNSLKYLEKDAGKVLVVAPYLKILSEVEKIIKEIKGKKNIKYKRLDSTRKERDVSKLLKNSNLVLTTNLSFKIYIEELKQAGFTLLIIEEADLLLLHENGLKAFSEFEEENSEAIIIGATATPTRNEVEDVMRILGKPSKTIYISDMVEKGIYSGLEVRTKICDIGFNYDTAEISNYTGDYSDRELAKIAKNDVLLRAVIETYKNTPEYNGQNVIVNVGSIEQAEYYQEELNRYFGKEISHSFTSLDGNLEELEEKYLDPNDDLKIFLHVQKYERGVHKLFNTTRGIINARPYYSQAALAQILGRIMGRDRDNPDVIKVITDLFVGMIEFEGDNIKLSNRMQLSSAETLGSPLLLPYNSKSIPKQYYDTTANMEISIKDLIQSITSGSVISGVNMDLLYNTIIKKKEQIKEREKQEIEDYLKRKEKETKRKTLWDSLPEKSDDDIFISEYYRKYLVANTVKGKFTEISNSFTKILKEWIDDKEINKDKKINLVKSGNKKALAIKNDFGLLQKLTNEINRTTDLGLELRSKREIDELERKQRIRNEEAIEKTENDICATDYCTLYILYIKESGNWAKTAESFNEILKEWIDDKEINKDKKINWVKNGPFTLLAIKNDFGLLQKLTNEINIRTNIDLKLKSKKLVDELKRKQKIRNEEAIEKTENDISITDYYNKYLKAGCVRGNYKKIRKVCNKILKEWIDDKEINKDKKINWIKAGYRTTLAIKNDLELLRKLTNEVNKISSLNLKLRSKREIDELERKQRIRNEEAIEKTENDISFTDYYNKYLKAGCVMGNYKKIREVCNKILKEWIDDKEINKDKKINWVKSGSSTLLAIKNDFGLLQKLTNEINIRTNLSLKLKSKKSVNELKRMKKIRDEEAIEKTENDIVPRDFYSYCLLRNKSQKNQSEIRDTFNEILKEWIDDKEINKDKKINWVKSGSSTLLAIKNDYKLLQKLTKEINERANLALKLREKKAIEKTLKKIKEKKLLKEKEKKRNVKLQTGQSTLNTVTEQTQNKFKGR